MGELIFSIIKFMSCYGLKNLQGVSLEEVKRLQEA